MLNLDTQIVLSITRRDLRPRERELLAEETWSISAAVFWELAKLVQIGRIDLNLDDREIQEFLESLYVWLIYLAVALTSTRLDFRSDPADELIAATSVVHRVPLLTRDRVLRASNVFLSPYNRRHWLSALVHC